jgi:hypothetical protein
MSTPEPFIKEKESEPSVGASFPIKINRHGYVWGCFVHGFIGALVGAAICLPISILGCMIIGMIASNKRMIDDESVFVIVTIGVLGCMIIGSICGALVGAFVKNKGQGYTWGWFVSGFVGALIGAFFGMSIDGVHCGVLFALVGWMLGVLWKDYPR